MPLSPILEAGSSQMERSQSQPPSTSRGGNNSHHFEIISLKGFISPVQAQLYIGSDAGNPATPEGMWAEMVTGKVMRRMQVSLVGVRHSASRNQPQH